MAKPDAVMDLVLSIILISAVLGLIAYFLFQAWNAGVKMYRRQIKKKHHKDKANQGVEHRDEDESSEVRSDKQKKEDEINYFEGKEIRRSELYEGVRGNRNPFDETANADITRNPLWMKQAEVEEEPLELQFWQAPNKGQVERDDDEVVTDRSYDPALNSAPKEEKEQDDGVNPPALGLATPGVSPSATPRRSNVDQHLQSAIELADLKSMPGSPSGVEPTADDFVKKGVSPHPRGHRRIKSHDDDEIAPKPERDDS